MNNNKNVLKVIAARPTGYRESFAVLDIDQMEDITTQAVTDQQNGVTVMKGMANLATVAEKAHYKNSWMASFSINGFPKNFNK